MLNRSIKWGVISGGVMVALSLFALMVVSEPTPETYRASEVYGYATMIASLCLIYLAMNEAGRSAELTVWNRIVLGVLVSVVAGILFGVYNVVYTTYLNPEFMDSYFAYYIAQIPEGPDKAAQVAELNAQKEMFQHPASQFIVMGATVVVVGIPLSILLAFVHTYLARRAASTQ